MGAFKYNTDFRKEIHKDATHVMIIDGYLCPKCGERLVALPPDRAWCMNKLCNYGELHLVGSGVTEQSLTKIEL